jgi:hypothetical protein
MVMIASTRNSHCQPESPCAPSRWEKANANTPLTTPERFPRISGIVSAHFEEVLKAFWTHKSIAIALTFRPDDTSSTSAVPHRETYQLRTKMSHISDHTVIGIDQDLPSPIRTAQHTTLPYSSLRHDTRARYLQRVSTNPILTQHTNDLPQVIIILDCHLDGNNLFNSKFDGASATMYGIYNPQPCPMQICATTHIIHRRH